MNFERVDGGAGFKESCNKKVRGKKLLEKVSSWMGRQRVSDEACRESTITARGRNGVGKRGQKIDLNKHIY